VASDLAGMILDVFLPDLNSHDLQKLVADRLELPVIFITAYGDTRPVDAADERSLRR
jgi:FixJ family two-component response regulator